MPTWQHGSGHAWRYDSDEILGSMTVRFDEVALEDEAACACRCGRCRRDEPHRVEEGCACALTACPCLA